MCKTCDKNSLVYFCMHCKRSDPMEPNPECKYGHITTTGQEAKFLGKSMFSEGYYTWLINGKCVSIPSRFNMHTSEHRLFVIDKSAPTQKRYVNLYWEKVPNQHTIAGGAYSSFDAAFRAHSTIRHYLTTVEITIPGN